MLLLQESDVLSLLPMSEAVRLTRLAFEQLGTGDAQNQPRRRLVLPSGAVLHSMAGAYGGYFGTKIYSTHPSHGAHFLFLLYRSEDGVPLALIEANHLGRIRTGAASGVATGILAALEADTLGVIGAGFQARTQIEAILQVRRIRSVRVWSRTAASREKFARECSDSLGIAAEAASSARQAVEGASLVVTATSSREPVLDASWIGPGVHINAIGSNQAGRRELPSGLVKKADLIAVDSIEQARVESGDLLLAFENGEEWESDRLVELAEIACGARKTNLPPGAITIFKSNGLGVEDVAVAAHVYELARKSGRGEDMEVLHS